MTNVINWINMANLGHNFGKNSTPCIAKLYGAQWFHTAEIRRKCNLLDVISRVFPNKFQQIHIPSVSNHCILCIFKTCQIVAGTSMIRQFHEFFYLIFGGSLLFGPILWRRLLYSPVVTDALYKSAF